MKPMIVTMGTGGRIKIPRQIVQALNLKTGDLFKVTINEERHLVLTRVKTR
jgi:bifunctional DNA-binding transcriptional regulator/antitoxin component of YhaV-PrlF toxin-antitoxin module